MMRIARILFFISAILLIAVLTATSARADPAGASIEVTTFNDEYNLSNGQCSLREAIVAANTDAAFGGCPAGSGLDTIHLSAGVYTLTLVGDEDASAAGDLDILDSVIIHGDGLWSTFINGNDNDRVIEILAIGSQLDVEIRHLTIENGYLRGASDGGGGIHIEGADNQLYLHDCRIRDNYVPNGFGGGLDNYGSKMVVRNCTIEDNDANVGGGIYTDGETTIYSSLIAENFGDTDGGGIDSGIGTGTSSLTLENVTVSGNTSENGSGLFTDSVVNINYSTIVENYGAGDGIANNGTLNIKNSIVANNGESGAQNCGGTGGIFNSQGYNLENVDSCGFSSVGDQPNTPPLLDSEGLKFNGGPTKTIALLRTSPAVDAADNASCPAFDQRGIERPQDGDLDEIAVCDIGAFEIRELRFFYFPTIHK